MKKFKAGKRLLFVALLVLSIGLFGCSGDNGAPGTTGATGAQGPAGPTGPTGPAGPVTTTGEACAVCHGSGQIVDVANYMGPSQGPESATDIYVTNIALNENANSQAVVTFAVNTAADGVSGTPVAGIPAAQFNFILADLVPANTSVLQPDGSTTTYSTSFFEQYAREAGTFADPNTGLSSFVDNGNGTYSYTFVTPFGSATTGAGLNNDEFKTTDDQRLAIDVRGFTSTGGTTYNSAGGFFDFAGVPGVGNTATEIVSQRQFVTIQACEKCHGPHMENAAHADHYPDTRFCVLCHSPLYGSSTDPTARHQKGSLVTDQATLPQLIHQIHGSIDGTSIGGRFNWSDVTYPEEINNCVVCHSNPANQPLPAPDANGFTTIDAWKTHPTRFVCTTCHITTTFGATNPTHPGGTQLNDDNCVTCHPSAGAVNNYVFPIPAVHSAAPKLITTDSTGAAVHEDNRPEFIPHITITAPANGQYYAVGETPEVTVTLTVANPDGTDSGTAVDPSVYTTLSTDASSAVGVAGGGLHSAVLMVYGPRANALPVLTTDSTTDPNLAAGTAPEQEHSLLLPSTDPLVKTDSTGFHYQLEAIPASLPNGTYMVQFQGSDYGGVSNTDYVTGSTALINIQVGTATVEAKVDGNGCVNCHGVTRMHQGGKYAHNVPFNTDFCLACHDQSGNHGIPIADRVHAVHDANTAGDLENLASPGSRNWDAITFPQNDVECVMCHTADGSGTYLTKPYEIPCYGCHADGTGAVSHMQQNGGPYGPNNPY